MTGADLATSSTRRALLTAREWHRVIYRAPPSAKRGPGDRRPAPQRPDHQSSREKKTAITRAGNTGRLGDARYRADL